MEQLLILERKVGVIQAGLSYAASQGWNTKTASILGGTKIIAQNYIAREQDTLYYQKFNVVGSNRFNHQYQQNILAAQNEGSSLMKLYKKMDSSLSNNYSFIIPLYKNTPNSACPRPATNKEHPALSDIRMGDVNLDGNVNLQDAIILLNYLNGTRTLEGKGLEAAKVKGNANVSLGDAILLLNYLNGVSVLPVSNVKIAKTNDNTALKLSPNGTVYTNLSKGTEIKIISFGTQNIGGSFWDLAVTSKGLYGYIAREKYE